MSDGAHEGPTEGKVQLTSIEKLVQANRDYYHSWRAMWASDDDGAASVSFVKEENNKPSDDDA